VIRPLDLLRSKILKETVKVSFFRGLILDRANRIFFLSMCALGLYLILSLFFPLWVLLIGPIIWGVPHLISSFRYNTILHFDNSVRHKVLFFQSLIWLSVFGYRIAVDIFQLNLPLSSYPLLFEIICMLLSFSVQIFFIRKLDRSLLFYSLFFSTLIYFTYRFPVNTAVFLLIAHNYIPLVAWFKSCQTRKDSQTFWFVSSLYVIVSALILFGGFDFLYHNINPQGNISFLNWDYSDIVKSFGASAEDFKFWFHWVCLYAFSQAMHYFLWIKAIPENHQPQQHPPSFNYSFSKLANDFGSTSLWVLISFVVLGLAYWLFFEFQTARLIYFSIASFHGFMEFAAIPFLKSNRKNKWN
jgi:hypothetical protein